MAHYAATAAVTPADDIGMLVLLYTDLQILSMDREAYPRQCLDELAVQRRA